MDKNYFYELLLSFVLPIRYCRQIEVKNNNKYNSNHRKIKY